MTLQQQKDNLEILNKQLEDQKQKEEEKNVELQQKIDELTQKIEDEKQKNKDLVTKTEISNDDVKRPADGAIDENNSQTNDTSKKKDKEPNENGAPDDLRSILKNMNEAFISMQSVGRSPQTWDPNKAGGSITIKSHIKQFEKMADRFGWPEKTKADELILSLRGQARRIAEALPSSVTDSYESTKKQLIESFSKEKPAAVQMRAWSSYQWHADKQTIVEFATILKAKLNKISKNNGKTAESSELFLKNRLMEAIKEAKPEFAKFIELNRDDNIHDSYERLYRFIQEKWDIYKNEEEEDEEREATNILYNEENFQTRPRGLMQSNMTFSRPEYRQQLTDITNRQNFGRQNQYISYNRQSQYPYNQYQRILQRPNFQYNQRPQYRTITQQVAPSYGYNDQRYSRNNPYTLMPRQEYQYRPQYRNNYDAQPKNEKFQNQNNQDNYRNRSNQNFERKNRDPANMNRGTKVENGQKVRFIEQTKDNQKN